MGDDFSFQERDYTVGGKKDQNESVVHEALSRNISREIEILPYIHKKMEML